MERSFVADAISWMEQAGPGMATGAPDLDDESAVLSFCSKDGRHFSLCGAEYPSSTTVLGDTMATFSNLTVAEVIASVLAPKQTRLQADLQQVLSAQYQHLGGLKCSPEGELTFRKGGRTYSVTVSEKDYPRASCVMMEDTVTVVDVPLPQYLQKLDQEPLGATRSVKKHKSSPSSSESGSDLDGDDGDEDEGGEDDARYLQSSGECCSEDLATFAVAPMCNALLRDVEAAAQRFGPESCSVVNQVEDQMTLGLRLLPSFLSSRVATAWGIVTTEPIVIALKELSASSYCAGSVPSVKVWQDIDGVPVQHGVIPQLQFITIEFVKTAWRKFRDNQGSVYMQDLRGLGRESDANIAALVAMGFSESQAASALAEAGGKMEGAVELLTASAKSGSSWSILGKFSPSKKKAAAAAPAAEHNPLTKPMEAALAKKNAFRMDWRQGLLVGLLDYLTHRLASLNEYCPLCDEGHMFGAPMLKPAICRRELCAFAFSKLGLLSDTVDGVATQAEVVDLLVAMCKAAACSARASVVLDPCPLIFDPKAGDEPVISSVAKHLPLILDALNGISMSTMLGVSKSKAQAVHPLSFSMLQWVVSSNRSHLVRLGKEKHLACMGTPHQFLLLSAPPEVEEAFSAKKAKSGTVWAFHGSRSENWHAILRQGVRNLSGTAGQLNGAAYGPGVYVSPTASMSLGYSQMRGATAGRMAGNNNNVKAADEEGAMFLDGGEFYCLSICEIISGAEKRHNAGVWTIVDDTQIVTRFFMVWPPGTSTAAATRVVSTEATFIEQVQRAMIGFD